MHPLQLVRPKCEKPDVNGSRLLAWGPSVGELGSLAGTDSGWSKVGEREPGPRDTQALLSSGLALKGIRENSGSWKSTILGQLRYDECGAEAG